jgi:hypothetical protein
MPALTPRQKVLDLTRSFFHGMRDSRGGARIFFAMQGWRLRFAEAGSSKDAGARQITPFIA